MKLLYARFLILALALAIGIFLGHVTCPVARRAPGDTPIKVCPLCGSEQVHYRVTYGCQNCGAFWIAEPGDHDDDPFAP